MREKGKEDRRDTYMSYLFGLSSMDAYKWPQNDSAYVSTIDGLARW